MLRREKIFTIEDVNSRMLDELTALFGNHPRRRQITKIDLTQEAYEVIDPAIARLKEAKKITRVYRYLGLYSLFLFDKTKEKWVFYYKLVNNKTFFIDVPCIHENGSFVDFRRASRIALKAIFKQHADEGMEKDVFLL